MEVVLDSGCFVCGQDNPIGMKVAFNLDHERNRATAKVKVAEDFQGWKGLVHGGIIASLLDEAGIYACKTVAEQLVTAELSVRYIKPVPVNTALNVEAEIVGRRKKIVEVKAWLSSEEDRHAEATSKVFLL